MVEVLELIQNARVAKPIDRTAMDREETFHLRAGLPNKPVLPTGRTVFLQLGGLGPRQTAALSGR